MKVTAVVTSGVLAAGVGVVAQATGGSAANPLVVPIILAVIAAVGAGGAAMARVWLVERPGSRQSELNDLRAHVRQLTIDYEAARQRLDDERDERYAERKAASAEMAALHREVWTLERKLADALDELQELRGEP